MMFLTGPLRFVPIAALAAVLIKASLSLLDLQTLRQLYRFDRVELLLCLLATAGVIWVNAIQAILVVVVLAVLRFVHLTSRPKVEILGEVEGLPGFHALTRHPTAKVDPRLVLFRFNAPLVFFNAPHFKQEAQAAIAAAGDNLKWFVLDAMPITQVDATGYYILVDVTHTLHERGARLVVAGRMTEAKVLTHTKGVDPVADSHFPTMESAVQAYRALPPAPHQPPATQPPAP